MTEIVDPVVTRAPSGARPLWLWLPILGPMVAVLVALEAAYALVGAACRRETTVFLHLVVGVIMLATLLMTLPAVRFREQVRGPSTEERRVESRTHFMAVIGMLSGSVSALLILAQWLALFFIDPCALT